MSYLITAAYLWFDQDQVNKEYDIVVLNVFVGEAFAIGTLCEAYSFSEGTVVGFTVCGI